MKCEACAAETSAKWFSKVGEKKIISILGFLAFFEKQKLKNHQFSFTEIMVANWSELPNSELLVHFGGWKLILFHYEVGKRFLQFAIYKFLTWNNRYLEIPWTQNKNCHVLFIHYVQRTGPNSDRHPLWAKI